MYTGRIYFRSISATMARWKQLGSGQPFSSHRYESTTKSRPQLSSKKPSSSAWPVASRGPRELAASRSSSTFQNALSARGLKKQRQKGQLQSGRASLDLATHCEGKSCRRTRHPL